MSSTREKLGRDFGQEMEKAEEILANQRNGQRRREGRRMEGEGK